MSNELFTFLLGIVSGLIATYIAKFIDRSFSAWAASRPTRRFWSFLSMDTTIVLSAHSRYFGIKYPVWWTSFGDVQSLRDFHLFLRYRFYQRIRFRRTSFEWQVPEVPSFLGSEEDWSKHRFSNLVIIGGPAYNIKTWEILADIHLRLTQQSQEDIYHGDGFWKGRSYDPHTSEPTYSQELSELLGKPSPRHGYPDDVFTNQLETRSFQPTMGTNHELRTDYGIAIKCSNPYRVDKKVVIVYGAYDSGTKGAMDYITNDEKLGELLKDTHSDNNIWVIVETSVDKRKVVDTKKVACGTLKFLPEEKWPKEKLSQIYSTHMKMRTIK